MLKKLRLILGSLTLLGFALLFLDLSPSKFLATHLDWLAQIQIVPAILSASFLILAVLLLLTLLLGRIYCSVLCPLGLTQDLLLNLLGKQKFTYLPNLKTLRLGILALLLLGLIFSLPPLIDLLDPYSHFGRIMSSIGKPLAIFIHNGLDALTFGHFNSLAPKTLPNLALSATIIAGITFLLLLFLLHKYGRVFCNTLCPVGTILGYLSKFAFIRPRINQTKCTNCGQCARICKANCIDAKNSLIDATRCVACFNCTTVCKFEALTLRSNEPVNNSRRSAFSQVALGPLMLLGSATNSEAKEEPSENELLSRTYKPRREHLVPILPAGSTSVAHFQKYCVSCQLCVAACPNQILISTDQGVGFLQPNLSFEKNYCPPSCVTCTKVCPTGAIKPLTPLEKSSIQIGRARVDFRLCLVNKDKVTCQACQRNCPTGAVALVGNGEIKQPAVDAEKCIGCGACEFYCPARPIAAIKVFGNEVQHTI